MCGRFATKKTDTKEPKGRDKRKAQDASFAEKNKVKQANSAQTDKQYSLRKNIREDMAATITAAFPQFVGKDPAGTFGSLYPTVPKSLPLVVEIAATEHILPAATQIYKAKKYNISIKLASSSNSKAIAAGTLLLPINNPIHISAIAAHSFDRAPSSVTKLAQTKAATFQGQNVAVTPLFTLSATARIHAEGVIKKALYCLNTGKSNEQVQHHAANDNAIPTRQNGSHMIFNHASTCKLKTFKSVYTTALKKAHERIRGVLKNPDSNDCGPFHERKQTISLFQESAEEQKNPLDRVSTDTTGPIDPPDIRGNKNVQPMTDAASRAKEVAFTPAQSFVPQAILNMLQKWQLQLKKPARRFHLYGASRKNTPELLQKLKRQGTDVTKNSDKLILTKYSTRAGI